MADVVSVSPEAALATKDNIVHPGNPEQAAAAAEKAEQDITDVVGPKGVEVTVDPQAVPVDASQRVVVDEVEVDEDVPFTQPGPVNESPDEEAEPADVEAQVEDE